MQPRRVDAAEKWPRRLQNHTLEPETAILIDRSDGDNDVDDDGDGDGDDGGDDDDGRGGETTTK